MEGTFFKGFATLAVAVVFAGCASTGDPRQGGIFWSEDLAKQRKEALVDENRASWRKAGVEQAKTAELRRRRDWLRGKIAAMQSDLSNVIQNPASSEVASSAQELEETLNNLPAPGQAENIEQLEREVLTLESDIDRLKKRNRLLMETR